MKRLSCEVLVERQDCEKGVKARARTVSNISKIIIIIITITIIIIIKRQFIRRSNMARVTTRACRVYGGQHRRRI